MGSFQMSFIESRSLHALLVTIAVLLFLFTRHIKEQNMKLLLKAEDNGKKYQKLEQGRGLCKADLGSSQQVLKEVEVEAENVRKNVEELQKKLRNCNKQTE